MRRLEDPSRQAYRLIACRASTTVGNRCDATGAAFNGEATASTVHPPHTKRFIYLASPLGTIGGGMFKVADYLIQAQAVSQPVGNAQLRALDTRGSGSALLSLGVLVVALGRIVAGRLSSRLAGVHVNMAERLSVFRKGVVIVCCRALGVPVVLHLHAAELPQSYGKLPAGLRAATRWIFSLASSVIVLGETARNFVVDVLHVPAGRVDVVFNGVPQPYGKRAQTAQNAVRQILFLGNLSERKGVSDLLAALALPGFDRSRLAVTLAGGGDVRAYQAKARALGLEQVVKFTGWCEQARVADLMSQADVLVLPSYDEGLPLVILEALASRVAVVCTPVGEIGSVLTHDLNVCLVQPGDVAGLAAGLQRVLDEPGLGARLARNGRAIYEQKFSISRFFSHIAQIHQRDFGISAASRLESNNHSGDESEKFA